MKKIFWLPAVLVLGAGAVLAAEDAKVANARKEAEMYAARSQAYRNRPPRQLSAEEQNAEVLLQQAGALNAQAESIADADAAIARFREAVKAAPKYDLAWAGLGLALWNRTNFMPKSSKDEKAAVLKTLAEAKSACGSALALDPNSVPGNYWLSNLILTEAGLGNWLKGALVLPEVFKLTDKVAAKDPYYEFGAVFRTYAAVITTVPLWLTTRVGYSPEVILPYLAKGIELEPNYFGNYTYRAMVYLKLGDEPNKTKALADLEYVLSSDPNRLAGYQADNRGQQQAAAATWKQITGKNYPAR